LAELKLVSQRKKLRKYFPLETVEEFISLLEVIAENFEIASKHNVSRDAKDNFLLDLIDYSNADYLVTGDKDLLELDSFMNAKIVTPRIFETTMTKL
jgi:putative PIN family toxin of toxin-antitoxin system